MLAAHHGEDPGVDFKSLLSGHGHRGPVEIGVAADEDRIDPRGAHFSEFAPPVVHRFDVAAHPGPLFEFRAWFGPLGGLECRGSARHGAGGAHCMQELPSIHNLSAPVPI